MQDRDLYEYAVIRVVPRVEREEFINTGIILFCKKAKFIKVIYKIDITKLSLFSAELDLVQIEMNMKSFEKIAAGAKDGGPIAQMDIPSRFRWLTAVRSSVIQPSRPHSGFSSNLDATLERLFEELIL